MPIVTKQSLQHMINSADSDKRARIIGRALVVLLERQTSTEQNAAATHEDNGVGFTSADARSGTLTAKSFIKMGTLQEWQVSKWVRPDRAGYARICKYHRQLNEVAERKSARV